MVTGYAESTVMKNEKLPAQMEILTKPFAMNALVEKVGGMLALGAGAEMSAETGAEAA
jgi:hypothetical protein